MLATVFLYRDFNNVKLGKLTFQNILVLVLVMDDQVYL